MKITLSCKLSRSNVLGISDHVLIIMLGSIIGLGGLPGFEPQEVLGTYHAAKSDKSTCWLADTRKTLKWSWLGSQSML